MSFFRIQIVHQQKDKLTNEYLTAFALAYSGHKLPRQFSKQRLWLTQNYNRSDDKAEFLQRMADVADYWTNIVKYNRELQGPIPHYGIIKRGPTTVDDTLPTLLAGCRT